MLSQRTMTRLAVNALMDAGLFHGRNVCVAGFTRRLSCKVNRPCRNFRDRRSAVVSIFAKALGHDQVTDHQEDHKRNGKEEGKPEEMT